MHLTYLYFFRKTENAYKVLNNVPDNYIIAKVAFLM